MAGVFQTAPPSWPGGTTYVFQRIAPLFASRATTLPRTFTFGSFTSPYSAEVPMYTVGAARAARQRLRWRFREVFRRQARARLRFAGRESHTTGLPNTSAFFWLSSC